MLRAALGAVLAGSAWAQAAEEPIVRVTTNLVQVEAIVTDRNGRIVTDLEARDFQLLQDGDPREITAFSLVRVPPSQGSDAQTPQPLLFPAGASSASRCSAPSPSWSMT